MVVKPGIHATGLSVGHTRPTDDQRDAGRDAVGKLVIAIGVQLPEGFTVVGGDYDNGVVEDALVCQCVEDNTNMIISIAYAGIIAIKH